MAVDCADGLYVQCSTGYWISSISVLWPFRHAIFIGKMNAFGDSLQKMWKVSIGSE